MSSPDFFVCLHKSVNITKIYFGGMLEFRIHKMYADYVRWQRSDAAQK